MKKHIILYAAIVISLPIVFLLLNTCANAQTDLPAGPLRPPSCEAGSEASKAGTKTKSTVSMMLKKDAEDAIVLSPDEKAAIASKMQDAKAGLIKLDCIDAFNSYNFCVLANKVLGNLYKSHGCLHVSPVNVRLLNELLPIGSVLEIKPYNSDFDEEKAKDVPALASLIDYKTDLKEIKKTLASKKDVKTIVYPGKGAYLIMLKGEPFAGLSVQAGPEQKMYMYQYRDNNGIPVFDSNLAGPTPAGKFFIFKKVKNYLSNAYRDQTTIPMGAMIRVGSDKVVYEASEDKWLPVPSSVAQDIQKPKKDRTYDYFDLIVDDSGNIIQARWASNTFGSYPIILSRDMKKMAPELVHTTCDLIIDDYQMLSVMVDLLSNPYDTFDECAASTESFYIYKSCYDFMNNTSSTVLDPEQSASYKLYYDIALNDKEIGAIPPDMIVANKVIKKNKLSSAEEDLLINEGMATRKAGKFAVDMKKAAGLQFYTYQNVVMIKKFANLYSTIKDNWDDLSSIRNAVINDMGDLSINNAEIAQRFGVALMMQRIMLQELDQNSLLDELSDALGL